MTSPRAATNQGKPRYEGGAQESFPLHAQGSLACEAAGLFAARTRETRASSVGKKSENREAG